MSLLWHAKQFGYPRLRVYDSDGMSLMRHLFIVVSTPAVLIRRDATISPRPTLRPPGAGHSTPHTIPRPAQGC